jgi:streptogramin lyase
MNLRLFILFFFISAFNISLKAQTVTDPWATLGASNIATSFIAMDASNNLYVTNYGNATISKITPNGTVTQAWATLAGNSHPYGIVIDALGNLYTANRNPTNTVSKITPTSDGSSGTVIQTWASISSEAYTIAIDALGNLYIPYVNQNRIDKIVPSQSGTSGVVTANWKTLATGANPFSISFDADGNLYSANSNNTISKITSGGIVTNAWATLAASSNAQFMVFDAAGNMYVSCWGTSTVSKITPSAVVTETWATVGTNSWPAGIVCDAAGNIFVANFNNNTISKITSDGTVTQSYVSLASGSAPFFLAKDATGNLYTTNMGNGTVSKISSPNIYITSSGQKVSIENINSIISPEGGANFGIGRDIYGKKYNTTNVSTTSGSVGLTTAILGGTISPTNGISSSFGVVYSTNSNFTTYSTTTIQSNAAAGNYTSSISGLASATIYYAKAFATNSAGTNYGNVVNFTTTSPATPSSFKFSTSNLSGNLPNYYLATSNLTLSQLPTTWTIQWTYRLDESPTSADGMHWFFTNPSTTGKYSTDMHVYQTNDRLQFWYNGNSYTFNNTYQDYLMTGNTQNSTYKIAVTYDGTNLKTYSNGVLISTFAINITVKPSNSTLRMGSNVGRTIDEFRFWNSALTSAQITANQGSSATGSSGLMLYYNFNDGTAGANNTAITSVVDQSGNNRNGTFYNTALTGTTNNFVTSIVSGF